MSRFICHYPSGETSVFPRAHVGLSSPLLCFRLKVCAQPPSPHYFHQATPHGVLVQPHIHALLSTLASASPATLLQVIYSLSFQSPSIHASTHPFIHPFIHPPTNHLVMHPLSIYASIHSSVHLSSIYSSIYPPVHPSIYPSLHPSMHPTTNNLNRAYLLPGPWD